MTVVSGCSKSGHGGGIPSKEKRAIVSTIAGDGTGAFADGPALSARFHSPIDVAVATDGTIFVADYGNHRIREISGGQVFTLAGSDSSGFADGVGIAVRFEHPYRLAADAYGSCYVLDEVDPRIRRVAFSGYTITYAGTATPGYFNGDASDAQFAINAAGLASDGTGNIYIGDTFNGRIRMIDLARQVTTTAGDGKEGLKNGTREAAEFRFPGAVACDRQGNIYVADQANFCIRKITTAGVVSTFAGSGVRGTADGDAATAQFFDLIDLVVDSQGNIYLIDDQRIRKVTPAGVVKTITGGTRGYADGDGAAAKFKDPGGLGIDAQDNIYVADINNHRIRKISFQ